MPDRCDRESGEPLAPEVHNMTDTRLFDRIIREQVSDGPSDQARLFILSWNAGPKRDKSCKQRSGIVPRDPTPRGRVAQEREYDDRSARNLMPGKRRDSQNLFQERSSERMCEQSQVIKLTSRQDQIWQRKVEQSLDDWVGHESASRFGARNCERFEW